MTAGPGCTGFSASWCPNCGDCTCPHDEEGIRGPFDDPSCPLHRCGSEHFELEWEARQVESALERMNRSTVTWAGGVRVLARGGKLSKKSIAEIKRYVEHVGVQQPISILLDDNVTVELTLEGQDG